MILELLLAAAAISAATDTRMDRKSPPAIGAQVEKFELYDIHRRLRSTASYPDAKAFVFVFVGTECPIANVYLPKLAKMHQEYGPQGIQFIAVNANPQDSFLRVSGHAQEREVPFPVLKDFEQSFARSIGATRTPEVFLLDASFTLLYQGRIDDQYTVTHRQPRAKTCSSKFTGSSTITSSVGFKPCPC